MGHRKHELTALVFDRRGRLLAVGLNSYTKTHPLQSKYSAHTTKPNRIYIHAELQALLRAVKRGEPHRIVVERRGAKGNPLLAKPCDACMRAIADFGIKKIEWTNAA